MANRGKCAGCGSMELKEKLCSEQELKEEEEEEERGEEAEVVRYQHVCGSCGHLVCRHKYQFWIEEGRQVIYLAAYNQYLPIIGNQCQYQPIPDSSFSFSFSSRLMERRARQGSP